MNPHQDPPPNPPTPDSGGKEAAAEIAAEKPAASAAPAEESKSPAEPGADPQVAKKARRRRRRRKPKSDAAPVENPAAGAAKKTARRPAKRSAKSPGKTGKRSQHHALTALRSLSAMTEGLLEVEGIDLLSRPRFLEIQIKIPLDSRRDGQKAAGDVMEQIFQRVREVREHDRALLPGSVYCYFSESADAEGCRPDHSRKVFDGYSSTGRPQFTDFLTMAIERKDPGVEELAAGGEEIVTHVSVGRLLRTQQLAEFGKESPVFRILGQVDAGLYPLLGSAEKAAFSFQILRGSTLEGQARLRLHPVGAADLNDLADSSVPLILSRFQRRLDSEALRLAGLEANGKAPEMEEFVLPLLQELAKQLKGRAKRAGRRTVHADQRSLEGQRPTAKASEDALKAADENILGDDSNGTVVVLGPRGRVHVFNPDGKHVTSLVMTGSNIGKRQKEGRWRRAEPEERGEFRIQMRALMGKQAEADAATAKEQPEEVVEKGSGPEPVEPA